MSKVTIPDSLKEYFDIVNNWTLVPIKDIPEELLNEWTAFEAEYRTIRHVPPEMETPFIMPEDKWEYENCPIPNCLKKYNKYILEAGILRIRQFRFVPPWLWGELKKYKKAEAAWNQQREYKVYEQNFANNMTWEDYQKKYKNINQCIRIVDAFND